MKLFIIDKCGSYETSFLVVRAETLEHAQELLAIPRTYTSPVYEVLEESDREISPDGPPGIVWMYENCRCVLLIESRDPDSR